MRFSIFFVDCAIEWHKMMCCPPPLVPSNFLDFVAILALVYHNLTKQMTSGYACGPDDCNSHIVKRVSPGEAPISLTSRFRNDRGTIQAIRETTEGHISGSDPIYHPNLSHTMSDFDVTSGNWTVCDQKSLSSVNLEDEFTPTAALEFGLDLDCPVGLPELKDDPDMMDRVSHCPAVHDIALKNFEELYDFDNEDSTEESWRQGFDTLASKSDGDAAPGFVYDPNDEACAADAQKQISVRQDAVDPAELSVHAVEGVSYHLDFSDLSPQLDFLDVSYHLDSSDLSVHDLHGPFPGDFEFPDGPSGLDLAQHSQTTVRSGYNSQGLLFSTGNIAIQDYGCRRNSKDGCSDTSLVALELRSEQNSEDASHIELTKPPRQLMSIQRNKQYSQNSAYTPLIEKPTAWDIFEYTKDGELHPSRLLSAKEIHRFLFTHPLHKGHRKLKDSPLKLRVHKTPASSAKRFPNGLFCRFKDCPMRTINQGQLLVIVDELSVQHPDHDLYLNAAYFHLFCIEMFCDFAEIVANLAVTAEGRETRKEPGRKNHFLLSHEEEKVVEDFVDGHGGWVVRVSHDPQSPSPLSCLNCTHS